MLNTILTAICENATTWTVLGEVRKRGLGRIEIRCTRIDVRDNNYTPPTEETPWVVGFWFIPQGATTPRYGYRTARLVGTTCFQGTYFDSPEERVRAEARTCFSLPTCAEEAA
jgi:hypothetical protein